MKKLVLAFIIFTIILFAGIFIMLKPSSFITQPVQLQPAQDKPVASTSVPRVIILTGSVLIIVGLVGLSVLGFRAYKNSETTTVPP